MAKRKLRIKMRNSLHGPPIAIPDDMSGTEAGEILAGEMRVRTAIDTGALRQDWDVNVLSKEDVRVTNTLPYSRRIVLDGHSKQFRPGVHNDAIRAARARIKVRGEEIEEARGILNETPLKVEVSKQRQGALKLDVANLKAGDVLRPLKSFGK